MTDEDQTAKENEENTVAGVPQPSREQLDQYAKDQEAIRKNPNQAHTREALDFMAGEGGDAPEAAWAKSE